MSNVYIICPVRKITDEQRKTIDNVVYNLEVCGNIVYLPYRDNIYEEKEENAVNLIKYNSYALMKSDLVYVYYDPTSEGSILDIGIAYGLRKKIYLINKVMIREYDTWLSKILLNWNIVC